MTEFELSERLKQGDNEARRELYERFAGKLLSLCQRYVGRTDEAEDVLHDCFLQVYTSRIQQFTFRGDGSLAAWLRRVFTNFALTHLERSTHFATDDVAALPDTPDEEEAPPDISVDTLHAFISELPAGYRTVLNLFLIEGWSHAEIAKKLNIKESTSASQYLRAKKLLKERITNYINAHES